MLILALLFVPIAVAPHLVTVTPDVNAALETLTWFIWAAFVAEYLTLLYLAPDRRRMIRSHWVDLVIIALPFLRPLRAVRALRLLRAFAGVGRAAVAARRISARRGFRGFLLIVLGVLVVGAGLVYAFERGQPDSTIVSFPDALWWAVVTATTVGYGDAFPVTPEGRGVAAVLMLLGIALLSVVTANIAAYFIETDEEALADVKVRLDRIEALLERLTDERSG